ncbi:unnamed protein product, partial [Amoebophrya sp. A120]
GQRHPLRSANLRTRPPAYRYRLQPGEGPARASRARRASRDDLLDGEARRSHDAEAPRFVGKGWPYRAACWHSVTYESGSCGVGDNFHEEKPRPRVRAALARLPCPQHCRAASAYLWAPRMAFVRSLVDASVSAGPRGG